MSVTPKIHLVAFEDRQNNFIFVAVPDERGRYLRTDKSVALVSCQHCKSSVGEPCRSGYNDGYSALTHVARRLSANRRNRGQCVDDVLAIPVTVPDEFMEAQS